MTNLNRNQSNSEQNQIGSETGKNLRRKPVNYMQYAGMATFMVVLMAIGAYIGRRLDAAMDTSKPYMTLACVVFALFAAFYVILKDLIPRK
jgi:uncharacterized membrane protein YfcA